jgi:hypothetical protein
MFMKNSPLATALLVTFAVTTIAQAAPPTYSKDVAPILYQKCTQCHHAGGGAPMSLMTFQEVRPWGKSILKQVSEGTMPPWHANPAHGSFKNDRSLDKSQKETVLAWINQGMKQGSKNDLPTAPIYESGEWELGTPDQIITYDTVNLKGGGPDRFFDLVEDAGVDEDKWLTAVEIRPSNKLVAHHVILYQQEAGSNEQDPDGWLGAWAAGAEPMVFPAKTGRILKKGSKVVADMHYHPAETPESDTLTIGLHFADTPDQIEKELINLWIVNQDINIPAGKQNHVLESTFTFQHDSHIMGFLPHMHYRGREFTYTATYPDGSEETLLDVDNYDFSWQTNYVLEEPKSMPKGTRIDCVAVYDNSANNPHNPNPEKTVTWGDESFDEMMIGFIDYVVDDGIRPPDAKETVAAQLADWVTLHPSETYSTSFMGQYPGALRLTAGANSGEWLIALLGEPRLALIKNLVWDGDTFKGTTELSGVGEFVVQGTKLSNGNIQGKIAQDSGFAMPFVAKPANE